MSPTVSNCRQETFGHSGHRCLQLSPLPIGRETGDSPTHVTGLGGHEAGSPAGHPRALAESTGIRLRGGGSKFGWSSPGNRMVPHAQNSRSYFKLIKSANEGKGAREAACTVPGGRKLPAFAWTPNGSRCNHKRDQKKSRYVRKNPASVSAGGR